MKTIRIDYNTDVEDIGIPQLLELVRRSIAYRDPIQSINIAYPEHGAVKVVKYEDAHFMVTKHERRSNR